MDYDLEASDSDDYLVPPPTHKIYNRLDAKPLAKAACIHRSQLFYDGLHTNVPISYLLEINELRIGRHKVAVPESDFVKLSARFVSGSDEEEAQSTLDRKLKMTAHCLALYTVFENPLAASGGSGGSKRSNLQVGNSCAPPEKGRELSFSECNGRGQRVS